VGFAGHDAANRALIDPDTDLVVAIGTKLGEWATGGWDTALLNERLVHVESVEGWLTRSPMAKLHLRGHLLTIFEYVLRNMQKRYPGRGAAAVADTWRRRMLENASRKNGTLNFSMQPSACYLADTGNSVAWVIHHLHPFDRRIAGVRSTNPGFLRTSLGFASMAWAIGAAIGTALGHHMARPWCVSPVTARC
jgi:acetolactate synthase I/II/III large subunit